MALLLAGYYYWRTRPELSRGRRWLLFLLRFISLAVLLLLLLSPILYYLRSLSEKQQVLVLTDVSASMDLSGPATGAKKDWLSAPGKELADKFAAAGYELHHYDFATGLEPDRDNTLLAPALAKLAKAGANHALSQEQVVTVVQKEAKRRREAALEYEKGGATARVNAELAELAVLEAYLPKALSDAEVEELARQVIAEVGATTPKELGKVMGPLVARVNGRADGKVVSATVRRLLGA